MVNRKPINQYPLPKAVSTIQYSLEFEEFLARTHAGIPIAEYEAMPGDPRWCTSTQPVSKAEIVVAYRLQNRIHAIQEDVQAKQMKGRRR